jgi:hypothetical protein
MVVGYRRNGTLLYNLNTIAIGRYTAAAACTRSTGAMVIATKFVWGHAL